LFHLDHDRVESKRDDDGACAERGRRRAMADVVRVASQVQRGRAPASGLRSEHSESASQEGSGGSVLRVCDRRRGEAAGASAA
jgi:hypothetical protein